MATPTWAGALFIGIDVVGNKDVLYSCKDWAIRVVKLQPIGDGHGRHVEGALAGGAAESKACHCCDSQ